MDIHEIATMFPPLPDDEYGRLRDSIREMGVQNPATVHEGKLVDGVHRYKACTELGIELPVREWDGIGSLADFVYAQNRIRRHLTPDQMTHVEASYARWLKKTDGKKAKREGNRRGGKASGATRRGESKSPPNSGETSPKVQKDHSKESTAKAAKRAGVGRTKMTEAVKIAEEAPDLSERVKSGEISHAEAKDELGKRNGVNGKVRVAESQAVLWDRKMQDVMSRVWGVESQYGNAASMLSSDDWSSSTDAEKVRCVESTVGAAEELSRLAADMKEALTEEGDDGEG